MIELLLSEFQLLYSIIKDKKEFVLKQEFSKASQLRDVEIAIMERIKTLIGEEKNKTALNILICTFLNEKFGLNLQENYSEKEIIRELKLLNLLGNV